MAVGTIFTLVFLPAIYLLIARDHSRDRAEQEHEVEPLHGDGEGGSLDRPAHAAYEQH
jgi:hypothetical protein